MNSNSNGTIISSNKWSIITMNNTNRYSRLPSLYVCRNTRQHRKHMLRYWCAFICRPRWIVLVMHAISKLINARHRGSTLQSQTFSLVADNNVGRTEVFQPAFHSTMTLIHQRRHDWSAIYSRKMERGHETRNRNLCFKNWFLKYLQIAKIRYIIHTALQ